MSMENSIKSKHSTGLAQLIEEKLDIYFARLNGACSKGCLYEQIIREVEKPLLKATLKVAQGNKLKASEMLGINRNTLRKKLKEHALE